MEVPPEDVLAPLLHAAARALSETQVSLRGRVREAAVGISVGCDLVGDGKLADSEIKSNGQSAETYIVIGV